MRQHDMSTGLKPPPWGAAALVPGGRDTAAGGAGGADGSQFFDLESDLDETFKVGGLGACAVVVLGSGGGGLGSRQEEIGV